MEGVPQHQIYYKVFLEDLEMFRNKKEKRWFGMIVAIVGCLALVSVARADWQQQDKLLASDGFGGAHFGVSVSISGDYAIAGSCWGNGNVAHSGSAYIFKRDGTSWIEQPKLTTSDAATGDRFGARVSIRGDYAIVGADRDDDNGDSSGSAYIFKRRGTSWIQVDKLTASDGIAEDIFGVSVSISGDYALAGAYHVYPSSYPGSAYIFKRVCPTADLSGDCRVDWVDFATMARQWLQDN